MFTDKQTEAGENVNYLQVKEKQINQYTAYLTGRWFIYALVIYLFIVLLCGGGGTSRRVQD